MPQPNADTASHRPMIDFPPRRNYRPFTRAHLRQRYGPSNPLYEIVENLSTADVFVFEDDFLGGTLNTDVWTTSGDGSYAPSTTAPMGVIIGATGGSSGNDSRLVSDNEMFTARRRPIAMARIGTNDAVTNSKFEFGFIDAAADGAVLVKSTPTSTAGDFAVIVRDTTHNTSVDMVTGGGTDADALVASSPGITYTTQTWYTVMIALNELKEAVFYIDGVYQGFLPTGPDATVTLSLWLFAETRTSGVRDSYCDFIKAWGERIPFTGDAFTT